MDAIPRKDLGGLKVLGRGGTATVYSVPHYELAGLRELAYKEYDSNVLASSGPSLGVGLLALVRFRQKFEIESRELWDQRVIWPLSVVTDDSGEVVGFLMSLIPPSYLQRVTLPSGSSILKARELDLLMGDERDMARIGISPTNLLTRLALVAEIAATYAMMHDAGVVVGDISARNIVYDPSPPRLGILVVDTDSARIQGTRGGFKHQPQTLSWEPPEARLAGRGVKKYSDSEEGPLRRPRGSYFIQNKATDVYKFGLIVLRVTDPGRGRAIERDPSRAAGILNQVVGSRCADLLLRSCGDDAGQRPTMREWSAALFPVRVNRY